MARYEGFINCSSTFICLCCEKRAEMDAMRLRIAELENALAAASWLCASAAADLLVDDVEAMIRHPKGNAVEKVCRESERLLGSRFACGRDWERGWGLFEKTGKPTL
jgi:hypothetical protein